MYYKYLAALLLIPIKIAETEWLKTFDLRSDMNLTMGEYIIMPNHFHAIIIIGNNQYNTDGDGGDGYVGDGDVETQCIAFYHKRHRRPINLARNVKIWRQ